MDAQSGVVSVDDLKNNNTTSDSLVLIPIVKQIVWKGVLGPDIVKADSWSSLLISDAKLVR